LSSKEPRFAFGKNWQRFLAVLDEERIAQSKTRLQEVLEVSSLEGSSFLDVGSGSGLSSLAAHRLGARVRSFDYDPHSVACTAELQRRYADEDDSWKVGAGDALDAEYLASLGSFDVVYSWGVLHHTGDMWKALGNVADSVAEGGLLYLAIYNHQVYWSGLNRLMKKAYVTAPAPGRWLIGGTYVAVQVTKGLVKDLVLLRNPMKRYRDKKADRGMSMWHDWIDWVGGYPFEVAKPEEIFDFYRRRGFSLETLRTCGGGHGCNEFVFRRQGGGTGGA